MSAAAAPALETIETSAPIRKCDHGIYIPTGSEAAYSCSLCNPDLLRDVILLRTMARRKPTNRNYPDEHTMDAADFMQQEGNTRIEAGREFFGLESQ